MTNSWRVIVGLVLGLSLASACGSDSSAASEGEDDSSTGDVSLPSTENITSCPVAVEHSIDTNFGKETETGENEFSVQTGSPIYVDVGTKVYSPADGALSVFVEQDLTFVQIRLANGNEVSLGPISERQGFLSDVAPGAEYQVERASLLGLLGQMPGEDKSSLFFQLDDGFPGGHLDAYSELSLVCQQEFRELGKNDTPVTAVTLQPAQLEWTAHTNGAGDLEFELPGVKQGMRSKVAGVEMEGIGWNSKETAYSVVSGDIGQAQIDIENILLSQFDNFEASPVSDSQQLERSGADCLAGEGLYLSSGASYKMSVIVCATESRLHVGTLRGFESVLSTEDTQRFIDSFQLV